MKKRKIRFNGMDIVILVLVFAALALTAYYFLGRSIPKAGTETETVELVYVLEVVNLDDTYSNRIKAGQAVKDAVKRGTMGVVQGTPTVMAMQKASFNLVEEKEVYVEVPGKSRVQIPIQATAVVTERGYKIGDQYIYVGKLLSLTFPDLKCDGYCIDLEILG